MILYLIGSLRNPLVPIVAEQLRAAGHDTFDDWFAAGPEADDKWRDYEQGRGHSFAEALGGFAAGHVYEFDRYHLHRCEAAVLVLPAGRSGHLELGYAIGTGKPGYILLEGEPDRFDVMYKFADGVYSGVDELVEALRPPFDVTGMHCATCGMIENHDEVLDLAIARNQEILDDIEGTYFFTNRQ